MEILKKALFFALFLVPAAYAINFIYAVKTDQSGGTFGDTFGAANAFFSGAALMMLVYAVILQRDELNTVKDERNDTRKLLGKQEEINRLQETTLRKQSFEQSFFSIVQLISEERRALDLNYRSSTASIVTIAAIDSKRKLESVENVETSDLSDAETECGTVARLFITAFGLLSQMEFQPTESLVYASTLHALLDSDFSHTFLVLAVRWRDGDPRALQTVRELQVTQFIDDPLRPIAEELLETL